MDKWLDSQEENEIAERVGKGTQARLAYCTQDEQSELQKLSKWVICVCVCVCVCVWKSEGESATGELKDLDHMSSTVYMDAHSKWTDPTTESLQN